MQDSIFKLGKTLQPGIGTFCKDPKVKHVIGIRFKRQARSVKYLGSATYDFTEKSDYLYARDPSGQGPGLFLTGKIQYAGKTVHIARG